MKQECWGQNKSYSLKKKKKKKEVKRILEIAWICLLAFAEENTLFVSTGTGNTIKKNDQLWGHSPCQSNLIAFDSFLIWVDVVRMADVA